METSLQSSSLMSPAVEVLPLENVDLQESHDIGTVCIHITYSSIYMMHIIVYYRNDDCISMSPRNISTINRNPV